MDILFFVAIIVLTLLALTPAKEWIFLLENEELTKQADRITELENEIVQLTNTLNSISATNKKINFARILSGMDSIDANAAIYDSLKADIDSKPFGGNILIPFKKLFGNIFQTDKRNFFLEKPSNGIIIKKYNEDNGHLGIDYAANEGMPVYAAAGGLILFSGFQIDDGNTVIIQHENGIVTLYKHCSQLVKKNRDFVSQGELIAFSGNTGASSSGEHLHFEVWQNGKAVDPLEFLIN